MSKSNSHKRVERVSVCCLITKTKTPDTNKRCLFSFDCYFAFHSLKILCPTLVANWVCGLGSLCSQWLNSWNSLCSFYTSLSRIAESAKHKCQVMIPSNDCRTTVLEQHTLRMLLYNCLKPRSVCR